MNKVREVRQSTVSEAPESTHTSCMRPLTAESGASSFKEGDMKKIPVVWLGVQILPSKNGKNELNLVNRLSDNSTVVYNPSKHIIVERGAARQKKIISPPIVPIVNTTPNGLITQGR